ncbi:inositol 3-kinase isoform X2 [Punica granatum]|uniref:Inositol 3-kinase isoform X2 n=1 Tax=Punica granatum TaxID=22663 RepID=A0A6P8CZX0_PUNGR|nr:inositol 3-kinase isoform X2 [Punica granatum]
MVRDSKQLGHPPPTPASPHRGLIVGNYCHDVLFHDGSPVAESLGGAVSFISAVLSGLSIPFDSVSKVGPDFKYSPAQIPIKVHGSNTTLFHAHFDSCADEATAHRDRLLKRVAACDPISPSDLPTRCYDFGMAVGVGGEIQPQTLEKMTEICRVVFVDIQALIREFDPMDGTVKLVRLKDSGFYHLLPRIGFLKASSEEALFMDVEEVRRRCCVVVTNGKEGCSVYWKDGDFKIQPFTANQVDPTGAGDSFLGGLVGGLAAGLAVPDAALLGNLFGSLTVGQVGLPKFDPREFKMKSKGGRCSPCTALEVWVMSQSI